MSYCRWSSMNWMCDVYVYEDVSGGWTTHVAGRRRAIPPIPDLMGGRLSMALHRWSKAEWDKETRGIVYPYKLRGFVYRRWCGFVAFWHKWVHGLTLDLIPLRDLGLPHDGDTFNDEYPSICANTLEYLRSVGYKVPQYAIDALRSEHD